MARPGFLRLAPGESVSTHPSLRPEKWTPGRNEGLRHALNWVNLTTPLGLAVATIGGARIRRGPSRTFLADYYRWRFPMAGAFTVGDVIVTRHDFDLLAARRPSLFAHELVHSQQWAYCLGLPFLPLYVASMAWSWLRTGDRAARSFFERQAGLDTGGYPDLPPRPLGPVIADTGRRLRNAATRRGALDAGMDLGRGERP